MAATALLVMDFQHGITARLGDRIDGLLDTMEVAITAARSSGLPVIFVRVAFRPDLSEISPRNKTFSALPSASSLGFDAPATQIHPRLASHDNDIVVIKKRVSAFTGSDLEVILRSLDVDHLVLTGISTSGVVLSTLRQAADLDYELTVLRDGCADLDNDVHRVLLDSVFPRQAAVVTANEWAEGI